MKKPFEVGERVAIYSYCEAFKYFGNPRQVGTIRVADPSANFVKVEIDGTASQDTEGHNVVVKVHPKQCRRLKRKERRTVWINSNELKSAFEKAGVSALAWAKTWDDPELEGLWIEFREVVRKK